MAFFSYIRLRRVILLRSDIRLTPSGIRFASFGGEYNITEAVRLQYHCRLRQYHADEVSISLKNSSQHQNCGQIRTATLPIQPKALMKKYYWKISIIMLEYMCELGMTPIIKKQNSLIKLISKQGGDTHRKKRDCCWWAGEWIWGNLPEKGERSCEKWQGTLCRWK